MIVNVSPYIPQVMVKYIYLVVDLWKCLLSVLMHVAWVCCLESFLTYV